MTEGRVMTSELANKMVMGCINKYIEYLINEQHKSNKTVTRYHAILNSIMGNMDKPFLQIKSYDINSRLETLYQKKNWSDNYLNTVLMVLTGLFRWAKDNNYTAKEICLYNPKTGQFRLNTKAGAKPKGPALDTSNEPTSNQSTPKKPLKEKSQKVKKKDDSSAGTVTIDLSEPTLVCSEGNNVRISETSKKHIAISSLYKCSSISSLELTQLSIYDFQHNHLIIQSKGNRSMMRVIALNRTARNALYDYLSTRDDNYEHLFLGSLPGTPITVPEVEEVISSLC